MLVAITSFSSDSRIILKLLNFKNKKMVLTPIKDFNIIKNFVDTR